MNTKPLRFVRGGDVVTLPHVDPNRTLLEVLREDLHCTGTKEGCGEGDCGACTVVVGEADGDRVNYRAINSCIRLAHSVDGMALWTVEDIAPTLGTGVSSLPPEGARFVVGRPSDETPAPSQLHPAQQAMVDCHGSQCGFCTPGFVMSLFGLYQSAQGEAISREQAQVALSGNLCRCTGYRPILDAAQAMQALPRAQLNEAQVLLNLELLTHIPRGLEADSAYMTPATLAELLALRARFPQAQIVAGCTDVGLWVTKQHQQFTQVLDVTRVAELRRVEDYPHHIAIGAAVTLTDAFAALVAGRPQLAEFAHRFAGVPVRNSGTLGGNVANGSPIGDSMPLLIALGASVVLMRHGKNGPLHRELALEDLYTGYRQNVMAKDEVLAWIKVPKATANETSAAPGRPKQASAPSGLTPAAPDLPAQVGTGGRAVASGIGPSSAARAKSASADSGAVASVGAMEFCRVYKISKRFEDDISAVCLAVNLHMADGMVIHASIGAGGVAATPARARQTEAVLRGQPWNQATVDRAMAALRAEFSPISDMRASSTYRRDVLGGLLQRFWLESQGTVRTDLRQLAPTGEDEVVA